MYDVLHDADYRRIWDDNMLECYEICQLDRYNDIGYYSSESISFLVMVSVNAFIKTAKSVLCEKGVKFMEKLMLFWWGSITR